MLSVDEREGRAPPATATVTVATPASAFSVSDVAAELPGAAPDPTDPTAIPPV